MDEPLDPMEALDEEEEDEEIPEGMHVAEGDGEPVDGDDDEDDEVLSTETGNE